jgi:glycosyltransferase involved in cell wall biosynthesis
MNDCVPHISVIIPLYNKEKYVKRAIDSVLTQSYMDFEVIVVNDGSTDNGPEIVRQIHDTRIRLIDQKNAGVSAARNRGIREAKSTLMAFLDADDEWMPEFLAIIMRLRTGYPGAGAYATAHRIAKGNGIYRDVIAPAFVRAGRTGLINNYFGSAHKMWIHSSSVAVQRKLFDRIGGFREGYAMGEDVDMWFRIAAYYDIAYCPTVASIWRYTVQNSDFGAKLPEEKSPLSESMRAIEASHEVSAEVKKRARLFWTRMIMDDARKFCLAGKKDIARRLLQETDGLTSSPLNTAHTILFMALPVPLLTSLARQRIRLTRAILRGKQIISRAGMEACRNA